jgi:hypothetical protein
MLVFFGPVIFLLLVAYARVALEVLIVIFRISEHTAQLAEHAQEKRSTVG